MAQFLLSPGVQVQEQDRSQYTSTVPTGNVVAMIGYAERGPFEPTVVSSADDFILKFGRTLPDVPYLAQAAYKYFGQGKALMVVRAGDDKDPDIYPQAAQYASKTIRIGANSTFATPGAVFFTRKAAIGSGTFIPGAKFGFKITATHRAFNKPKIVETWKALYTEENNSSGTASPLINMDNCVIKLAYDKAGAKKFEVGGSFRNITGPNLTTDIFAEEITGLGEREDTTIGSHVEIAVHRYALNGDYATEDEGMSRQLIGTYGAVVVGTTSFTGAVNGEDVGYDWGAPLSSRVSMTEIQKNIEARKAQQFFITMGSVTYEFTMDEKCISAGEIVAEINDKLHDARIKGTDTLVDLGYDLEAFVVKPSKDKIATNGDTSGYPQKFIALRRKNDAGSVAFETTAGFKLPTTNPAAKTLGFALKDYLDKEAIYGEYSADDDVKSITGSFVLTKQGDNETGIESFEEPLEVELTAPDAGIKWFLDPTGVEGPAGNHSAEYIQAKSIVSQINAALDYGYAKFNGKLPCKARAMKDAVTGKIKLVTKRNADEGYRSIIRIKSSALNSLIDLLGIETPIDGAGERNIGEVSITLKATEKGSYGNSVAMKCETKKVQKDLTTVEEQHNVTIIVNGREMTNYQRVSWTDPLSKSFIGTLMAADPDLRIDIEDEDEDLKYAKLPDGIWMLGNDSIPEDVLSTQAEVTGFTVGTNGWESNDDMIITSMDADFINALKKLYNPEVYDFNLVCAPGGSASSVQNEVQALCESRHDCFGVLDAAPFGIGLGIKERLNHCSEINAMNENINSNYVGIYWPWLQDYDADNKQYVWLPPSIYALTQLVYTDNVADPWYAAAGLTRGKISAVDIEYSPTSAERDILYGDTNCVNPIVKFVGEGIAIWGQKTGQRTLTALNRINVRRLMIYAEKLIAKMARGFLFEMNDSANWAAFARQANSILEPIRQRRGMQQYQVICDATTNIPAVVEQNMMIGKIYIQPTKTIEFISVDFTITAQGDVSFTE
jgi:hypothetical protein